MRSQLQSQPDAVYLVPQREEGLAETAGTGNADTVSLVRSGARENRHHPKGGAGEEHYFRKMRNCFTEVLAIEAAFERPPHPKETTDNTSASMEHLPTTPATRTTLTTTPLQPTPQSQSGYLIELGSPRQAISRALFASLPVLVLPTR